MSENGKYRIVVHKTAKNGRKYTRIMPRLFDSYEDAEKFAEAKVIGGYNIQKVWVEA